MPATIKDPSGPALLDWYGPRRQAYPWRVDPDPYRVLVSEIMLQQTQVSRVVPAWERFTAAFPTVAALAAAPSAEVLRAWSGLGYNRRAIALGRAAQAIVSGFGGIVPSSPADLLTLPGVGAYTAAAVASCAYGVPVAAVDTNVRRVVARARMGLDPQAASPAGLASAAQEWLDRAQPGAWNQAVMDLGRELCRPAPRCGTCPISPGCRARAEAQAPPTAQAAAPPTAQPAAPPAAQPVLPAPGNGGRVQPSFAGSFRQLRGRIVALLRERPSASLAEMAERWAEPPDRVAAAVAALAAEGLVHATTEALPGRPAGSVRLG